MDDALPDDGRTANTLSQPSASVGLRVVTKEQKDILPDEKRETNTIFLRPGASEVVAGSDKDGERSV